MTEDPNYYTDMAQALLRELFGHEPYSEQVALCALVLQRLNFYRCTPAQQRALKRAYAAIVNDVLPPEETERLLAALLDGKFE